MNNLKKIRKQKKLTQVQLASRLEISPQRYNMYENGKRKLPIDIAKQISKIFKVSLEEIFLNPC